MIDRPGYHFTLPAGHLNDPLGVTWHEDADGGRYDVFYQLNPSAPAWAPDCRWGQADGPDLVRWGRPRTALEPAPGEGCWSGAVTVDPDGTPVIVYTSVDTTAPDLGRIVLAPGRRDWSGWRATGPPVVEPPAAPALHSFRDPFVLATADGWRMLVGAGALDGRALALQYSSSDLRHWTPDGVLAERAAAATDPLPTGSAWECPQLFPLDGAWVLLVSAWDRAPLRVVAAVGDYDGRRFTPRRWQPFDAAGELYATSAFRDATGRWCALSWLPGAGPEGAAWAGMLSLPHLLSLDGDRLCVAPHPDVDTLVGPPAARTGTADPLLDLGIPAGDRVIVRETRGRELLELRPVADGVSRLLRPGRPDVVLRPSPRGLRVLLDAGVAEVFTADGAFAVLRLDGDGGPVRLEATGRAGGPAEVTVRPVQRWFSR